MSWNPTLDPSCPTGDAVDAIETLIVPRARDLGGFEVRRALPAPKRQMVGPFIFFDQAGPAEFVTGQGVDVRPHPHIGLATVTYLFRGEFQHRDSLGTDQMIHPGRGQLDDRRARASRIPSGRAPRPGSIRIRSSASRPGWRCPRRPRTARPGFEHQAKEALPVHRGRGGDGAADPRLAPGASGRRSRCSARCSTPTSSWRPGAKVPLPDGHEDRGLYIVSGSVVVGGQDFGAAQMMVFRPGDRLHVTAGPEGARLMLLGGETLAGPRYIWWNFVASSRERIEAAKEAWRAGDWEHGRFRLPPGDDAEFIPLPQEPAGTRAREVK